MSRLRNRAQIFKKKFIHHLHHRIDGAPGSKHNIHTNNECKRLRQDHPNETQQKYQQRNLLQMILKRHTQKKKSYFDSLLLTNFATKYSRKATVKACVHCTTVEHTICTEIQVVAHFFFGFGL